MSELKYIKPESLRKRMAPQLEEVFGHYLAVTLIPNKKGLLCPFGWYNLPKHHVRRLWSLLTREMQEEVPASLPDSIPLDLHTEIPPVIQEGVGKLAGLIREHCKLIILMTWQFPADVPLGIVPDDVPPGTVAHYVVSGHVVNLRKILPWFDRQLTDETGKSLGLYESDKDHRAGAESPA